MGTGHAECDRAELRKGRISTRGVKIAVPLDVRLRVRQIKGLYRRRQPSARIDNELLLSTPSRTDAPNSRRATAAELNPGGCGLG